MGFVVVCHMKKQSWEFSLISFLTFLLLIFSTAQFVYAQEAQTPQFNISNTLPIKDAEAVDGDIVSLAQENETLVRTAVAYDEKTYGVLVAVPVMVYRTAPGLAVARSGDALVNITTLGGPIEVGDYITSSPIPGKGQKATELTGYMVGVALTSFDGSTGAALDWQGNKVQSGKIKLAVGIGPASPVLIKAVGGPLGTLRQMAVALLYNIRTSKQFERIIRYIIAALVAISTIFINFRTFGRNITKGIEAIGRNPLAKVAIQSMIVVNVILIAIVSLGGITLALAILSL